MAQAFVDQFIGSYATPPAVIVVDLDHSEDAAHGQQEQIFYNHHYGSHCDPPLFLFEGLSGKLITAALRPGKRPTGAENAAIAKRVLKRLRAAWPNTHILLRGDGHFANPELMQLALETPRTDFLFGLSGNAVLKAEVMALGDAPRFVVTSLNLPSPENLYPDLYCAHGQDENWIKRIKNNLASDRTSDHRFLANHLRLSFSCAACVLHQALRTEVLVHTERAQAQPATVILKLFKIAVRVVQYKDRVKLHLPSSCPVKDLLHRATEILFQVREPAWNTS